MIQARILEILKLRLAAAKEQFEETETWPALSRIAQRSFSEGQIRAYEELIERFNREEYSNKSLTEEQDRNARAYGWEVGQGAPIADNLPESPGNPFSDPDWRQKN